MAVFIAKSEFLKSLENAPVPGKHILEPSKSFAKATGFPAKILENCQVTDGKAEVHDHEGDLWYCLEGEVTFVTGGTLLDPEEISKSPGEWQGSGIEDGVSDILREGDWLWIPPGDPHLHTCARAGRMVIIKIPAT